MKEPTGLSRSDGRRPDGSSLVPWQTGKPITWDVTVATTLAASYVSASSGAGGAAAELAATNKIAKYADLPASYIFQPIALETLGPINRSAVEFLTELGRRISIASGEERERGCFYSSDFPLPCSDITLFYFITVSSLEETRTNSHSRLLFNIFFLVFSPREPLLPMGKK